MDVTPPIPAGFDRLRRIGVEQLASLTGYSVPHIRRLYRTGKIPMPTSVGGRKLSWPAGIAMDLLAPTVNEANQPGRAR